MTHSGTRPVGLEADTMPSMEFTPSVSYSLSLVLFVEETKKKTLPLGLHVLGGLSEEPKLKLEVKSNKGKESVLSL